MSDEIKKGLVGVISDETKVSEVMPEINSLTYRGYAVQELCTKCNFEQVAYLLFHGELPNPDELKAFEEYERTNRNKNYQKVAPTKSAYIQLVILLFCPPSFSNRYS